MVQQQRERTEVEDINSNREREQQVKPNLNRKVIKNR